MLHQITTKRFFFKLFLTPLRIEAFDILPSTFEDRKIGWLKIIVSVSPCAPKNSSKGKCNFARRPRDPDGDMETRVGSPFFKGRKA